MQVTSYSSGLHSTPYRYKYVYVQKYSMYTSTQGQDLYVQMAGPGRALPGPARQGQQVPAGPGLMLKKNVQSFGRVILPSVSVNCEMPKSASLCRNTALQMMGSLLSFCAGTSSAFEAESGMEVANVRNSKEREIVISCRIIRYD